MKRRISILSILLLAVALLNDGGVYAYPGGADPSVCLSMIPGHGPPPQTSPNPYKLILGNTAVKGGQQLEITLTSPFGTEQFNGFIVQVRKPGGDKTVGTFSDEGNDEAVRTMPCFGIKDSATTQTNANSKTSVTMKWIAPNDEDAEYQVYYSVVGKDFATYWTHIAHDEKILVTKDLNAATTMAPLGASPGLINEWKELYDGCGKTKGCFGMPDGCVQSYDPSSDNPETCEIMVTWKNKGGKSQFELTGRSGGSGGKGYVAVALSDDNSMGEDSVVGCSWSGTGTDVNVKRYINRGRTNSLHSDPKLAITVERQSILEGNIFCKFNQDKHELPGVIKVDFDKNYYLLLSKSPAVYDSSLGQHQGSSDRGRSPRSVHISDNLIMGASSTVWLVQLHGGLMVIAWLLCASTGMFTARYYKQTHTDSMPCGKAFWFFLHTFCMGATVFLTICGAILILVEKQDRVEKDWHPILGFIVVGLAILQVLIALCRPHPNTPKRPIFNWVHWLVGNSAHIIGIACIFLAWDLPLANLKEKFAETDEALWLWIMLSLVLFHVLMHVVMSIHTLWADKEMNSNNRKRAMHPLGPMKPSGLSSEAPGTGFRTFMLSLYLLVMAAGAISLFVLIFWPTPSKPTPTS